MKYCPISLEPISDSETFSTDGLRTLHPKLVRLAPIALSYDEQLKHARLRSDKMSIQGVQPKLSAVLRLKDGRFDVVDKGGRFILKPNPPPFSEVPANEALTMSMASIAGIAVPPHGLLPATDGSWIYAIQRFDRKGRSRRLHVEDFAQLSGASRETKYESSLEQVASIVETYCSFPAIEKPKLARLLLFCFLTGNEDMHLKNFSLIVREGVAALAPAYDLLNTTLVLENAREESALTLCGRKRKLNRKHWIDAFCKDRLRLKESQIQAILDQLQASKPTWFDLIERSYLSSSGKEAYRKLLTERCQRLGLQT